MEKVRFILLKFVKYLAILAGILVALSLLSYFFLADALNLNTRINEGMRAKLGIECSVGKAHVILLPKPGLLINDVSITPPDSWFAKTTVAPAAPSLPAVPSLLERANTNSTSLNQENSTNGSSQNIASSTLGSNLSAKGPALPQASTQALPQALPSVSLDDVFGKNASSSPAASEATNNSLYVENLSIYLDIFSLFKGKILTDSIAVDGLTLKVKSFKQAMLIIENIARTSTAPNHSDAESQGQTNDPWSVAEIANILASVHISNSSVLVWNAQGGQSGPDGTDGPAGMAGLGQPGAFVPLLEDIEFGKFLGKFGASFLLHVKEKDASHNVYFDLDIGSFKAKASETEFKLKIELDDGKGFNPNFSTRFNYDENSGIAKLEDLQLKSEKSSLTGDMQITFADTHENSSWLLSGPVVVKRLDLTRWIDTLRDLSPELQSLLSNIDANLDLVVNSSGIFFKDIDAQTGAYQCSGFGSVLDFENPVVNYDFSILNAFPVEVIFPELRSPGASVPAEPELPPRPDVPFFLSETDGPGPELEIIFRSSEVSLRNLKAKNFEAVLGTEPEATRWALSSSDIAGGNLSALIVVGDDDILDVNGDLKNLDLKTVLAGLEFDFPATGQLSSVVQLKGNTQSLVQFSQTMQLNCKGIGQNIQFGEAPASKSAERSYSLFNELVFDFALNGEPNEAYKGIDKFKLTADLSGKQQKDNFKFKLNGPLAFGQKNELIVEKMNLDGQISSQFEPLGFAGQETAKLKGSFDYLQQKDDFALNLNSFNLVDATGSVKLNVNNISTASKQPLACSGKIQATTKNLRQFLSKLNINLNDVPPHLLSRADLHTNFLFKQGPVWEVNLPNLKGQVDDTTLDVVLSRNNKGALKVVGKADSIDLDAYLPSKPNDAKQPPAKPWDVKALLKSNLQLSFAVDKLLFMKLNNEQLVLNASIQSANLEAKVNSSLYGGTLLATINGNEQSSRLNSSFNLKVENVNLQKLTASFSGGETMADGLLTLNTELTGQLASWDDVPGAFSGTWGFSVGKGYFVRGSGAGPAHPTEKTGSVSRTTGTESAGPLRSNFDYLRGGGVVEKGVFKTDNIDLEGPSTSVKGNGEINLDKKKINLSLDVRLTGVSFPIRLKGNLSDPEVTLKSGKFVTKNIWNLGEGLFDLVGGILTLPVKILEIPGNAGQNKDASEPENRP